MIRLTAEQFAGGAGNTETIGVLEIGNRSATGQTCDYDYRFGAAIRSDPKAAVFGPWHIVRKHDRDDGIWVLVAQILARREAGREEASDYRP